ncbi:DUF4304 domain-containing protein [Chitinophaga sp. HK235]|uniref:DUF4304 domain-containing protein n=1 Tax=Chitinophaga sp. HK235 TaxID=2952571 RepID=UPI001BA8F75F|nr:DUF4304 domain-containing protein [Chitinophaga sp. HK235]
MNAGEIFRTGCQKIAERMAAFGFKPLQKGQLLRKSSQNKKLNFEIYFQSSTKNWSGSVSLWPHLSITSNELKKWQLQQYKTDTAAGFIFGTRLENLTPLKNKNQDWNMAISNQDHEIPKLCELIITYALPVFEKFEDIDQVLKEIATNGLALNEHFDTRHQNLPIDFLCCFGNQDIAQTAFDNYLIQQRLTGNARRVFEEMETAGNMPNKQVTDATMKAAYLNNLKVNG